MFSRRTDAEAEMPILWPPDMKSRLIRKDPDAGKDWGQEEKGTTEDEMVGGQHWLNGREFEQKLRETEKDREVWHAAVHGVKKSRTRLSDWTATSFTQMESFHSALHLLGAKPQVNFSPLVSKVKNPAALIPRILARKRLSIHSFQTVGLTERKDWLSAWL